MLEFRLRKENYFIVLCILNEIIVNCKGRDDMSNQEPIMQEVHRCSSCGDVLRFDPKTQTLMCIGCDTKREVNVLEKTKPECPNCGAELTVITGIRQASCTYCGGTFQMLQDGENCKIIGEIPEDHKYIAPFTVSKEEYQNSVISWLASEEGIPIDTFDNLAMIRSPEGIYAPYYYCVVSYNVEWTASIGHDRNDTHTTFERRRDSQGNTHSVPVTRTRTVTDWHPHTANASGRVTLGMQATNYFTKVYEKLDDANRSEGMGGIGNSKYGRFESNFKLEVDNQFSHYRFQDNQVMLQPLDTKYTASFRVLPCDVQAEMMYDSHEVHKQIYEQIERNMPGSQIRDLSFHGDIIPDYFLIYRPYWMSVYTYDKRIYGSHSDGTNTRHHYGTRPIDLASKNQDVKYFLPLFASIGAMILTAVIGSLIGVQEDTIRDVIAPIFTVVLLATGAFGLVMRSRQKQKNRMAIIESLQTNANEIFQRKSATVDPISDI